MSVFHRVLTLLLLVACTPLHAGDKRPATIDDLMKVRNILDVRISPDGSEVLYVLSVLDEEQGKYNSDVWLVSVKDKSTQQLTRGPGRDDTPRWAPDGKSFAFLSDRSGKVEVWVLPRAGGEARKVTGHATPMSDYAWSPDGTKLAYLTADPESKEEAELKKTRGDVHLVDQKLRRSHLHVVTVSSGESKRLTSGKLHVTSFSWSPDGKKIAYAVRPSPRADDEQHGGIHELTLADGKSVEWVSHSRLNTLPKFSPDGKNIAFLSREGSTDVLDNLALCVFPLGAAMRKISAQYDNSLLQTPDSYAWSADSRKLYFTAMRGTMRHLCSLTPESNSNVQEITPPSAYEDHFSFSRDGKRVAFLREDSASPPEVYFLELGESGSPVRLTNTNPQVRELALGEVELIQWKSKDGLKVEGLLIKPVGFSKEKRYPTIAYVHGGPANQFMRSFALYPSTAVQASRYPLQVLAGQGYAIFCPNPRGSGSYGEKFRKMNVKDWGGGDFDDIMSGVDELIKKGIADPERLGIMGWSYGGYMTAWAITQTNRFKAASFGAGLTNLTSFYGQTDIPSFMERYWGGTPWEQRELYRKRSAMTFVDRVRTPTLIQHGEKDKRVPLAQSQELYAALKRRGVPVEMAVYPRQGHNVLEPRLQRDVQTRNLEWFNRWIKP